MVQMMLSGLFFIILVYSMQEEILSQRLSRRKYGHFKIVDFLERPVLYRSEKRTNILKAQFIFPNNRQFISFTHRKFYGSKYFRWVPPNEACTETIVTLFGASIR